MIRFRDEIRCKQSPGLLVADLVRMVHHASPIRFDGTEPLRERNHQTQDEFLGLVGPAMSFEHCQRFDEYSLGESTGLTIREVLEYYTTSTPDHISERDRYTLILSRGWAESAELRIRLDSTLQLQWQLPESEHRAFCLAWLAFRETHEAM